MLLLERIFAPRDSAASSDTAYRAAMGVSGDLIRRMRDRHHPSEVVRSITADIWAQARNVPFVTTVYEAVQEAKSGPESRGDAIGRIS